MALTETVLCQSVKSVQKTLSVQRVQTPAQFANQDWRPTPRTLSVVKSISNSDKQKEPDIDYKPETLQFTNDVLP